MPVEWFGGEGAFVCRRFSGRMKYNFNVEDVAALWETNKGLNEGKVCLYAPEKKKWQNFLWELKKRTYHK